MKLSDGMVFVIFLLLAAMYNSSFQPVRSSEGTTYTVVPASDEIKAEATHSISRTTGCTAAAKK